MLLIEDDLAIIDELPILYNHLTKFSNLACPEVRSSIARIQQDIKLAFQKSTGKELHVTLDNVCDIKRNTHLFAFEIEEIKKLYKNGKTPEQIAEEYEIAPIRVEYFLGKYKDNIRRFTYQ